MGIWSRKNFNKEKRCSKQEQRSLDHAIRTPLAERKLRAMSTPRRCWIFVERTQSEDAAGGSSPGLQVKAAQTNKVKRSYNAVRNLLEVGS